MIPGRVPCLYVLANSKVYPGVSNLNGNNARNPSVWCYNG
jgi:hypothetical protein